MMNLVLLLLLLLLSSAHLVFNGVDTHLNVKRSPANPRPNAAVREEVNGSSGSSILLDPKFTVDLSKEEVVWEWKKWNSTESVDILDHVPSKSLMVLSEQFKRRLEFNISNGVLTISPLECRDQGTYIVYVQGEKKKELHLRVYEKLSDAMILANSSSLGSTIQLTCNVTGGGPEYQWWYNGEEILEHHQLMDGNRTLIIKVASARDCGIFTCEATNPVSSVRANYTLTVPGFLPEDIGIVIMFVVELLVSLYCIVPVLPHCCKMGSALKNQKCFLGFSFIDILLLVGIFIAFMYWIIHKGATCISALVLCTMFAQLMVLILPFIVPKLSCPSIEYLQKFPGACSWTLYVVMVITSIIFFVIYGNNPGCDNSLETWSMFFSTRIWNVVIFFLSVIQHCRDKRRRENGSTVKGEQDTGELQELKLSAPDHLGDQ